MKRSIFLVIFIAFSSLLRCQAQTSYYPFRHLTVDQGLSHNQVTCILKDKKGFMWIGTYAGLNRFDGYNVKSFSNDSEDSTSIRHNSVSDILETPDGRLMVVTYGGLSLYDPRTEKFENNLDDFNKLYGLPNGPLKSIFKDRRENFWFAITGAGIVRYNVATRQSNHIRHNPSDAESISTDFVSCYSASDKGAEWIIHANGTLEQIEANDLSHRVLYKTTFLSDLNKGIRFNYQLIADNDGDLWIFAPGNPHGVYFFDATLKQFRHIHERTAGARLNSNLVSDVSQANDGILWVATDHGGLNLIDKRDFSVSYILHKPEDERSIGQNSITALYKDDEGILWLGTFKKGVCYYHPNMIRFPLYRHYPFSKSGLPFGDVNRFAEDGDGNLWIGTNGGGLIVFDRKKNAYRQFLHDPNDPASISSNVVVSLCFDHEKNLWIGTYFGGLNKFDGKKFIRYNHDPQNPESISDHNVWEIFEDSRKRLWIGTMHGGLDLFNRSTNSFSHYRRDDDNSIRSNYIAAITEDKEGNIWIGTDNGIDVLERANGRFFHYGKQNGKSGGLSDNHVFDIKEDSQGRIWIATRNGLNVHDRSLKTFLDFREKHGLPHNTILTILEDDQRTVWLSTPNGLCQVTANEDAARKLNLDFRNYDEQDGLQAKQFNENAAFKTSTGEMVFGGANGFNIFHPQKLGENKNPPRVVLSNLQLFNRDIRPGEKINGTVILPESVSETVAITLPPDQNVFAVEFAGISYFNPEKNQYQYMLSGFHTDWLRADGLARKAAFTNLDPGEYELFVKASNNDGYWNNTPAKLKIIVLPPFWKTRTAFVLYCLTIICGLLITRKLIQKRERLKFEREQERQEAIRMHELDMMKIKFFTNVSHEFRTPLTLIVTPIDKLIRQAKDPDHQQQYLLIQRNAKRLLNLVNQLLDFRKLEVQKMRLNLSEGDIVKFIRETVFSFSDLSEKKDIRLDFISGIDSLETLFDQDKLEKILFNLLSNAFKFTQEHGAVFVEVSYEHNENEKILNIRVNDTGIGIAEDKLDKIFDRFFQNELPKSIVNQGSGIGLSICKEFVKLHGGTIHVESKVGEGSRFTVRLPLVEVLQHAGVPEGIGKINHAPEEITVQNSKKPVLLLVEDNEDFRFYLKDNLKTEYRVVEAGNGVEGWKIALENLPDLIVSDIMMPEMSGIELCRKIKSDSRLSHTPVILLTARSAEEQKIEGFEIGADDYLTKPFNFEILTSRIRNLIAQREKFHKSFPAQLNIKASELKITSLDEQFIEKAIKCVEEHITDPDFSVEDLSHQLGISRAHFYKKVVALTGKSPLEFVRILRLQQAAQLLEKSQLTVAEIAYKVGFNNPKYFARYFKDEYNVLPSVYASEKRRAANS